jgi:hypothetical protein
MRRRFTILRDCIEEVFSLLLPLTAHITQALRALELGTMTQEA